VAAAGQAKYPLVRMRAAPQPNRRRLKMLGDAPPPTRIGRTAFERCGPSDVFHDYILVPYSPPAPPTGKLRSVNLLYEAFALAGVEDEGVRLVETVRAGLGPFRTVWGIKHDAQRGIRGFELYFYDFGRKHPDLSIERMRDILAPIVDVRAVPKRAIPWHMFSIELTPQDLRERRPVGAHVYVDMRSYELRGEELTFENIYTFHDPRLEIEHVLHRLRASLHTDMSPRSLASLMPPTLFRCHRVCVANKRTADALYFSRVPTTAMLGFLRAREWPQAFVAVVESHASALDHLNWCVGMDFTQPGATPLITKSGLYGSF